MTLTVASARGVKGEIRLPGDKSISHRAVILGSVAEGETVIKNFLTTGDCLSTVRCMSRLGVEIDGVGGPEIRIKGLGRKGLSEPDDFLDAGNSATTARLLTGLLAGQVFFASVTGDASLRRRPMDRVTEPLGLMGAHITGRANASRLPLAIDGSPLKGIEYLSPKASAQIKSALLLAGLYAKGKLTVKEPVKTRDHTERMLEVMGAKIKTGEKGITMQGEQALKGAAIDVPADVSSAAFFIVAALVLPDSNLKLRQVGMNSARIGLLDVLKKMGADIKFEAMSMKQKEPRADIIAGSSKMTAVTVGRDQVPSLIDELPILAVAATQAEGVTVIKGAGELRHKETDRIKAMVDNLGRMGAKIKERKEGMEITGPTPLRGANIKTGGDHRVAMACAVAGLAAEGETVIDNDACIEVSYPGFDKDLNSVLV